MRTTLILFALLCSLLHFSCNHPSEHYCASCIYHAFDRFLTVPSPYDTINQNGVFVSTVQQQAGNNIVGKFYAKLADKEDGLSNTSPVTADTFKMYWDPITRGLYNGVYRYKTNMDNVLWKFGSYSYNNVATVPHHSCSIPDSAYAASGLVLYIDSLSNADMIGVATYYQGQEFQALINKQYFSAHNDSIHLDSAFIKDPYGNDKVNVIVVSSFTHHYETINGFQYLFVKEYSIEKAIIIKERP